MPRGSSPKREREYREIEKKFEKEGRYKGREEEVAARIVNKQRREAGETKSARSSGTSKHKSSSSRRAKRSSRGSGSKRVQKSASARTSTARKSTSRSGSKRRTASGGRSKHLTHYTVDHDTIREWAEARGGKPSAVIRTERGNDPGVIRLDFPGYSGAGSLEEISWDEWFKKFDESGLALAYQDRTSRGQKSNFNKLVSRENVDVEREGRSGGSRRSSRSKRGGSSKRSSSGSRSRARGGSSRSTRGSASGKKGGSARASRSKGNGRSSRGNGRSPHLTHYTVDHDEIRQWAEERGGEPAAVMRTARGKKDPGIIRLDFPGYSGAGSLQKISWDEWFDKFDESGLALAYQERTARGQKSNFNKLISREHAQLH